MKFKMHSLIMTIFILIWLSSIDSKIVESIGEKSKKYLGKMIFIIKRKSTGIILLKNNKHLDNLN